MNIKTVTVFGSAFPKPGEPEYEFAYKLGNLLGENGIDVCSGGYLGIMEAVSKGAVQAGAKAIGVTLNFFNYEHNEFITDEIRTESLFDRIKVLMDIGDAFIILKGGTGTLLELAAVWECVNKEFISRKLIISDQKYWEPLTFLMDERMRFEGRSTGIIKSFNNEEDIIKLLKSFNQV